MVIPIDKQLHFFSGGFLASLAIAVSGHMMISFCVVMLAALAKEIYDSLHPDKHTKDVLDFAATVLGGAVVIGAFLVSAQFR